MKLRILPDAGSAAGAAAAFIAARARGAAAGERRFSLALSGGSSPQPMFDALARADLPWHCVELFQVDERLVSADSPQRNFIAIRTRLVERVAIAANHVHPMPIGRDDPDTAARDYAATLSRVLGRRGRLDLVHLGLGSDGHTASLIPGDPALEETAEVVVSQPYQGARRLSLSAPALSAARERVWLVTGAGKRDALARLLDGDPAIPAGRIERRRSLVLADRAAAGPRPVAA